MCQCGEAEEAGIHKGRGQCIKVSQRHQKWFHTRAYRSLRCSCLLCWKREHFFSFPVMRNISATEQETLPLGLSHAKKKTAARHSHAVWPERCESSSLMQQIKRWTLCPKGNLKSPASLQTFSNLSLARKRSFFDRANSTKAKNWQYQWWSMSDKSITEKSNVVWL